MTRSGTPLAGPTAGKRVRRRPLRPLSVVMLLVLAAVAVASSLITRNVLRDQEGLILRERTAEAAAVFVSTLAGIQSSLQLLGEIARSDQGHPQLFADAARVVTTTSTQAWLVTTQSGTGLRVTAAAGNGPAVGQVVSGAQGQLARRALSAKGLLVSGLVRDGRALRLAFGAGEAGEPGTVVWKEAPITPTTPTQVSPTSPWHSLEIAIYLSGRPDPSALVVTTTKDLPLAGFRYPFRIGADTWLIVARSPQPLVGSLAQDMPWIILALGAVAAGLTISVIETLGRRRDYASALVEERTAALRSAIAEREAAQARLIRQENMAAIGQLAATVGHELRNPLAVVTNVLYLMKAATKTADDPMHRHLATAEREISAATLIVSDLLDYAAGRGPILAPVEVSDLVAEALSVVPPPGGVQVVQRGDPLVVDADRDQIRQALLNLITNGYDSMPGGGVLTVSTTSVPGSAQITVTDTGMGMDEETRDSIFTPFFTKKTRGIGLGLAVTKRIVEAHGGTIAVESTPSVGSSFTLTLPVLAAMAGAPQ